MRNTSPITPWLDHLVDLLPPNAIHLVGAGKGNDIWAQWLAAYCAQVPVSLVEANPQQFAALQRQQAAGQWKQATLLNVVIAAQAGDVDFFTASLTAESGLLPAEDLQALWPNVHTVFTHSQPAMDLGKLLQLGTETPVNQQWVLLDCLPAAALLRSLQPHLQHVDVVVARVLHNADGPATLSGKGCSLEEVSDALPGFRALTLQASRHPALAHALFVRDYRSAAQQVQARQHKAQAEKAELLKKKEQQALRADLIKITQTRDVEAKVKQAALQVQADLKTQISQTLAEKKELLKKQELMALAYQDMEAKVRESQNAVQLETLAKDEELSKLQTEQQLRMEMRNIEVQLEFVKELLLQAEEEKTMEVMCSEFIPCLDGILWKSERVL